MWKKEQITTGIYFFAQKTPELLDCSSVGSVLLLLPKLSGADRASYRTLPATQLITLFAGMRGYNSKKRCVLHKAVLPHS